MRPVPRVTQQEPMVQYMTQLVVQHTGPCPPPFRATPPRPTTTIPFSPQYSPSLAAPYHSTGR